MSARAGTLGSAIALAFLSALSLAGALSALFVGLTLSDRLDSSNFAIVPAVVPEDVSSSADSMRVVPLAGDAFSRAELEDFTKKAIVEYITARYTVNGSEYLMDRALGIYGDAGGAQMKVLSSNAAYEKFKAGEAGEIRALMAANTTRAVRIVAGPSRHGAGRWITGVEFVYREPSTADFASARREYWDIHMEIAEVAKFRKTGPVVPWAPLTAFSFGVSWLEKRGRR